MGLGRRLIDLGAAVFEVSSPQEAAASAASRAFDVIVFATESGDAAKNAAQRLKALPTRGLGPALIGVFPSAGGAQIAEEAGLDGFLSRREALEAAPALIALLTRPSSVETAELDQVEQEDRGDKDADGNEHGHLSPLDDKISGAL
jgi:methylmalonyl-CoA mutase cobalamin-binding subunit